MTWRQRFGLAPTRIHQRLTGLLVLGASITALLTLLAVLAVGWWFHDRGAHAAADETARLTAATLEAPLAFADDAAAAQALAVLHARGEVLGAWVYAEGGRLAARYGRDETLASPAEVRGFGRLTVRHAVRSGADALGTLVLVFDQRHAYRALALEGLAVLLAVLAALAISLVAVRRLARHLADPVTELARAASQIAATRSYGRRLQVSGSDEIGDAMRAFNAMLAEVQARDEALAAANRLLEQRVRERTADLEQARARAEAASVAKTRFLANMSHELRTPLNAVLGSAQLLAHVADDAQRAHLTATISQSGASLLGVIENVLDISRIESGALSLSPQDFNLVDCVEAAMATVSVAARAKAVTLAAVVDPGLAAWRHGDALRLRQVLLNLLGNAVKFSAGGDATLHVEPGASAERVQVRVCDTGIGMDLATVRDIFEPFAQADDGTMRRFGGTGLGLSISREIVRAMGGEIEVRSTPGQGSTFSFEVVLPAAAATAGEAGEGRALPAARRVLYFEPHAASAQALAATLQRMGLRASPVDSAEALRAGFDAAAHDVWLLIAAEADNAWPVLEAAAMAIPPERVIAMNAGESHAVEAARQRFGLSRSVSKPVLRSALISRLGERGVRAPGGAPVPPLPAAAPGAREVLVVDDDPTNQMIVTAMLRHAGYRTQVADDGHSALALVARRAFDLVLMDWQMPDMDGLEVTRQLRSGRAGKAGTTVPVIALTANAFSEDRVACLAAGMNDFLTKPVVSTQLLAVVERCLAVRQAVA